MDLIYFPELYLVCFDLMSPYEDIITDDRINVFFLE